MPVDPQIAAMLKMLDDSNAPAMHEGSAEQARAVFRNLTAGVRTPEQLVPVAGTEDIEIPGAKGPLRARVYRPEGDGPFPLVAFFHGGGWVIGDIETHDNQARHVCAGANAIVVSVDYRLAPEHRFPAAADDAVAAARWLTGHGNELGGNGRLAVAGDSAGGNLSAVVAQQLAEDGTPLVAQFLIYPSVDVAGEYPSRIENAHGYFLDQPMMEWFFASYVTESDDLADPRLSPLHGDLSGLPPALIVTAEFDPLRDEGEAYGKALEAAGASVEVKRCDGMIHGFFDMGGFSPAAKAAIEEACQRFGVLLSAP